MNEHDRQEGQILDRLKQDAAPRQSFRERAARVGSVYTISYTRAIVAVYDYDREEAGGLPKCMFLLAAKQASDDDTFILLRI